ncbi:hypothetical protein ACTQ6A_12175 [Lachnospiraceae bacterium LCP25S3_G4]
MDIQMILTSGVVIAIVTALIAYYQNKVNNALKYITAERQQWRMEMREISQEISQASMYNIEKYLNKLKVRINVNGIDKLKELPGKGNKFGNEILEDAHIWYIIETIEKERDIDRFINQKEILVLLISSLLKYDWERAKKEVKGDSAIKILNFFLLFGFMGSTYLHFYVYKQEFNQLYVDSCIFFLGIVPLTTSLICAKNTRKLILDNITMILLTLLVICSVAIYYYDIVTKYMLILENIFFVTVFMGFSTLIIIPLIFKFKDDCGFNEYAETTNKIYKKLK